MLKRTRFLFLFIAASLCTFSSTAVVVTVVMDNGDNITGQLVSVQETSLDLSVSYMGKVSLPKARVVNLKEIRTHISNVEGAVDPSMKVSLETTASSSPKRELKGCAKFAKKVVPFRNWEKLLQVGMTAQSGRKKQRDFSCSYDMTVKRENEQFRFEANYYYGKSGDEKTSDKITTNLRWRRNFTPNMFYESTTSYLSDKIKLIDANVQQKLGVGTRLVENEVMTLSSGLGMSGRWREFQNMSEEAIYLVDLFQDWDYQINERFHLKQDFRVAMPLEESEKYEYGFTASLVSELTKAINLSLRYELGFDNSLALELREERRFISSLGYSF